MTARQLRALRGAGAAATAVLLAAVSHTVGGGSAPDALVIAAVAVLVWPLCTLIVGRRLGPLGLAIAVLVAQGALHAAFAATSGWTPLHAGGGHEHGLTASTIATVSEPVSAAGTPMLAAHLVAAAAAFVLLRHGEYAVRAIARWVVRLALRAGPAAPFPPVFRRLEPRPLTPRRRRCPQLARLSRRGPPTLPGDLSVA
ncbi:hypothetical protein AB2L57_12695 [Microbacterium sp. HA-8]|uniref:hypothetical protein n=1 Tax=Microbacterium sp. HA-8 TaxID=3234200 RepID=UPI0038F5F640